jgi:hypothetical protein
MFTCVFLNMLHSKHACSKKSHVNIMANLACMFDSPTCMLTFLHVENFCMLQVFCILQVFCTLTHVNMHVYLCQMMMMTFICSCRNNNQPTVIYPLGTFPRGLKKAHVMMLPSCPLWYYDDPFIPFVDVGCAKHFTVQPPSVPIYTNDRH